MAKQPETQKDSSQASFTPEILARFSDLLLKLYQAADTLPEDQFHAQMFEWVNQSIPIDAGSWGMGVTEIGPDKAYAGVQMFDVYFHKMPPEMLTQYNKFARLDTFSQELARRPAITFSICTHDWYPEIAWPYLDRFGMQHMMGTHIVNRGTGLTTGLLLWRNDRTRPFSKQEQLIKQALMPHWAAASSRNKIEPWVRDTVHTLHYPVAALADVTGELRYAAEGFAELLQREWPDWRGPLLPEPLRAQVAQLVDGQAAPNPCREMKYSGARIAAKITLTQRMPLLQVRSLRLTDQLSAQQMKVAHHCAHGLNFKEIARLTGLAPATVRTYLTNIYGKLGVKNKVQLAEIMRDAE